jgi:hypothetical protein
MSTRRHSALPKFALAAALSATALAAVATDHAAVRSTGTPVAAVGGTTDWNTMVPEGGSPAPAALS